MEIKINRFQSWTLKKPLGVAEDQIESQIECGTPGAWDLAWGQREEDRGALAGSHRDKSVLGLVAAWLETLRVLLVGV